ALLLLGLEGGALPLLLALPRRGRGSGRGRRRRRRCRTAVVRGRSGLGRAVVRRVQHGVVVVVRVTLVTLEVCVCVPLVRVLIEGAIVDGILDAVTLRVAGRAHRPLERSDVAEAPRARRAQDEALIHVVGVVRVGVDVAVVGGTSGNRIEGGA